MVSLIWPTIVEICCAGATGCYCCCCFLVLFNLRIILMLISWIESLELLPAHLLIGETQVF